MTDLYNIVLGENVCDESIDVVVVYDLEENELKDLIRIFVPRGIEILIRRAKEKQSEAGIGTNWTSEHHLIAEHPNTRKLAYMLKCSRHEAVGILVTLWQWGRTNTDPEGVIQYATVQDIAEAVMYRPTKSARAEMSRDAATFIVNALIESEWIIETSDGEYAIKKL